MLCKNKIPSTGICWFLMVSIFIIGHVNGRSEGNRRYSSPTRNDRFSYDNGEFNDNHRQYNGGYDYNVGSNGNLGTGVDSNYDNYGGSSRSSRNNYEGAGTAGNENTRKSGDLRFFGNYDSVSNRQRDVDSTAHHSGYGNYNYYGWNARENM